MNYNDIQNALATLARTSRELEEIYCENGGEVTEETATLEEERQALAELLNGEGVDELGRWLKSKEDELATYKAEKALVDRKIKSVNNTIDFIKYTVGQVLRATGCEKVKGSFYSFAPSVSRKNSVNTEALDDAYLLLAMHAVRLAGLPTWLDVQLKTTATALMEEGGDALAFLDTTEKETCTFRKPAKGKD